VSSLKREEKRTKIQIFKVGEDDDSEVDGHGDVVVDGDVVDGDVVFD